jgi:hypothetical protein
MTSKQFNNNTYPIPLQATKSQQITVPDLSTSVSTTGRSQLGADFKPSPFCVICGRGKESYDHEGNHNFRELATMFAARYSRAGSKGERTEIVSEMVGMIHQANGTFCQFESGAWFKVAEHYAREKAGALLRDMVHTQQRSPVKAKTAKKTKAKPANPRTQNKKETQTLAQYGQQLVEQNGTAGHPDDSAPTQQCGMQLVEQDGIAGGWHSDDSSRSTWSCCALGRGSQDVSNHRKRCDPLGFKENSLEDEDDLFFDIFPMDSSLHATRLTPLTSTITTTPLTGGAACCMVCVPSSLFNPAA